MSTTPNDPGGYGGGGAGYGGAPSYGSTPSGGSGTNVMGIIALVVGILGLVLAFCTLGIAGIVGGLVAVALGVIGRNKAKRGEVGGAGLALGGLIVGAIAVVVGIGVLIFGLFILNEADGIQSCSTLPVEEQQACIEDSINN